MKKIIILIIAIIILAGIVVGAILWYNSQIDATNIADKKEITVEIKSGMKNEEILDLLQKEGLIKNAFVAKIYMKLNNVKGLQAGKYVLSSDMSLKDVLNQISSGKVKNEEIKITFVEGKNMRWYAKEIADKTNNTEKDVFDLLENKEYIQSLINEYWFLTDEVTNKDIYYPLEGYLYPETYSFTNKDVSVESIFKTLLKQEEKVLNEYRIQIEQSKYSVHEILSLASILELETTRDEDRKDIASVMYNRLKQKMSLGSDVTTHYAIKVDISERKLTTTDLNTYNPYNTRGPNMAGKLPVGPISSISESSILAALNPNNTDYLYFVSDKTGKNYFTKTNAEHLKKIQELKQQGLWF